MVRKVHILIIFLQNKDLIARTNIHGQHLISCKYLSFSKNSFIFQVFIFSIYLSSIYLSICLFSCFARKTIESWYKPHCDFETAILHYIDGVGRKHILCIGRSREVTELAVSIKQNCRLKIAISLYYSRHYDMFWEDLGFVQTYFHRKISLQKLGCFFIHPSIVQPFLHRTVQSFLPPSIHPPIHPTNHSFH